MYLIYLYFGDNNIEREPKKVNLLLAILLLQIQGKFIKIEIPINIQERALIAILLHYLLSI